jgi:hypothetical protein
MTLLLGSNILQLTHKSSRMIHDYDSPKYDMPRPVLNQAHHTTNPTKPWQISIEFKMS